MTRAATPASTDAPSKSTARRRPAGWSPTTERRRIRGCRFAGLRNAGRDPRDRRERATAGRLEQDPGEDAVSRESRRPQRVALHRRLRRRTRSQRGFAAKVIVLVAKPLGLAVTNFDPDGDGGKPRGHEPRQRPQRGSAARRLVLARSTQPPTARSRSVWSAAACRRTPSRTCATANRRAGAGTSTAPRRRGGCRLDAAAIQALVAADVPVTDADLRAGLVYLAEHRSAGTGAWQSFGATTRTRRRPRSSRSLRPGST